MSHPVRVLLIDGHINEAAALCKKLAAAKNSALVIETVETLQDAYRGLSERRFDVVLIDLKTPGSNGISTLPDLQSRVPETPLLVVSSVHDEYESLETVRSGAQDYLVKSRLNAPALERILTHCIERQRGKSRTQMQYLVSRLLTEAETQTEANTGILKLVCEFLEYDFGQIWMFDHWSAELIAADSWEALPGKYRKFQECSRGLHFERGRGLPGRTWEKGRSLWITNIHDSTDFGRASVAVDSGLHSALTFPITLKSEVLGVIELFSKEVREADEELLRAVLHIGTQLGQFLARKRAEEEREQLNKQRILLLDCASEGIYGVDLNSCITFMNRAAAQMFGCNPADVSGQNSHHLFHHSHPDGTPYAIDDCPTTRVFRTGEGTHSDDEFFWRTDGTHLAVDYSVFPVIESGRITGAVVCFRDITESRRMEIELRHAQKLEAVGGLAAGIAHEINTPIQFVGDNTRFLQDSFRDGLEMVEKYEQVYAEALKGIVRRELLDEVKEVCCRIDWEYLRGEIPKAMDQMLDGIGRVAKIVRAMKEFSHVDRSPDKAPSDINKALESTLIVARSELKYVADVEVDFGTLPPVMCHLGDLNQVFLNLLINAAHAIADIVKDTGERGRVIVRTRHVDELVEISISDTGTGIPESLQEKIFDPFFTTKEVGKGTGQGLTLARAIVVEKHGGMLTFKTDIGKGTTFFVRLPVNGVPESKEVAVR